MGRLRSCQSTSPDTCVFSDPSMKNRSRSLLVSEETFHQNVTVTGPLRAVSIQLVWLFEIFPL